MAFTANPYCALPDIKSALDLQSSADDQWIAALILQAQATIDSYLGYSFQSDTGTTRIYSGDNDYTLFIDECQSFTLVQETTYNTLMGANGIWQVGSTITTNITADVVFLGPDLANPPFTQLGRISGLPFSEGRRNYVITGTWGYTSIPADITRAATRLVLHWVKMRDANYQAAVGQQQFGTPRFLSEMPADVRELLNQYRRRRFYAR